MKQYMMDFVKAFTPGHTARESTRNVGVLWMFEAMEQ